MTCDLLHKRVVEIEKNKKINILLPSQRLINMNKDNKILLALPKKIPMIVPP